MRAWSSRPSKAVAPHSASSSRASTCPSRSRPTHPKMSGYRFADTGDRMVTRFALLSLFATVALATTGHMLSYPAANRDNVVADYHGVKIPDPYRWMEDIDSPATRAWVEAEGKLSRGYLEALPGRADIAPRLQQLWNFDAG